MSTTRRAVLIIVAVFGLVPVATTARSEEVTKEPGAPSSSVTPEAGAAEVPGRDAGAREHRGFYFRVATGPGHLEAYVTGDPDVFEGSRVDGNGLGTMLAAGGSILPGLAVGALFHAQQASPATIHLTNNLTQQAPTDSYFDLFAPMVDWFPAPRYGLHVIAATGLLFYPHGDPHAGANSIARGWGASLGVGYDFWISSTWSLGILANGLMGATSAAIGGMTERNSVKCANLLFTGLLY
jgi:hypothetical protein